MRCSQVAAHRLQSPQGALKVTSDAIQLLKAAPPLRDHGLRQFGACWALRWGSNGCTVLDLRSAHFLSRSWRLHADREAFSPAVASAKQVRQPSSVSPAHLWHLLVIGCLHPTSLPATAGLPSHSVPCLRAFPWCDAQTTANGHVSNWLNALLFSALLTQGQAFGLASGAVCFSTLFGSAPSANARRLGSTCN